MTCTADGCEPGCPAGSAASGSSLVEALTDAERRLRAETILDILRGLQDRARLEEIIVIQRCLQRLYVVRDAQPAECLPDQCSPACPLDEWSVLDEALRIELTDVGIEREQAEERPIPTTRETLDRQAPVMARLAEIEREERAIDSGASMEYYRDPAATRALRECLADAIEQLGSVTPAAMLERWTTVLGESCDPPCSKCGTDAGTEPLGSFCPHSGEIVDNPPMLAPPDSEIEDGRVVSCKSLQPDRLRRAREMAGLSLGQAGYHLTLHRRPDGGSNCYCPGCSGRWLDDIETGDEQPTDSLIRDMSALYGVAVSWLCGADPVISADTAAMLFGADISSDERAALTELIGATRSP